MPLMVGERDIGTYLANQVENIPVPDQQLLIEENIDATSEEFEDGENDEFNCDQSSNMRHLLGQD